MDPPPHCSQSHRQGGGGFIRTARSRQLFHVTPTPFHRLPKTRPSPGKGGGGFATVHSSDNSGSEKGVGVDRDGFGGSRSAFTLRAHVRIPASRSKFQGRRRQGGYTGKRPAARPVLQARRRSFGVVGSPMRLQTRKARTPLAPGPSAEGGGSKAVMVGVAGGVRVVRARAKIGAPF